MLGAGIAAVADGGDVVTHALAGHRRQLGETLQELRLELLVQPEHVGQDEDLAVAVGACADADRRDLEGAADLTGESAWDQLEDDRERPRVLTPQPLLADPPGMDLSASLAAEG